MKSYFRTTSFLLPVAVGLLLNLPICDSFEESITTNEQTDSTGSGIVLFGQNPFNPAFYSAFAHSLVMIIATELGDKTFFIAAVLAMRNSRALVFLGALGALAVMTVLSVMMGFALPNLIPRKYTHFAGGILFLYFGIKLLYDAYGMEGGHPSDELQEVEEELINKKDQESPSPADDVERGDREQNNGSSESSPKAMSKSNKSSSESDRSPGKMSPFKIFTQSLTLTFLAEWGDRSQIATIAMAASRDPLGVTVGGVFGHFLCTGLAVVGGRMLAQRISEKTVTILGGVIFLFFGIHAFVVGDVE